MNRQIATYTAPVLREIALLAERGYGASLEIPVVDPEQGWAMQPHEEYVEE